jgi:hypothetical protein
MPAPPNDPRHIARLLAAMVPDEIARSISNAEYNDRILKAALTHDLPVADPCPRTVYPCLSGL